VETVALEAVAMEIVAMEIVAAIRSLRRNRSIVSRGPWPGSPRLLCDAPRLRAERD